MNREILRGAAILAVAVGLGLFVYYIRIRAGMPMVERVAPTAPPAASAPVETAEKRPPRHPWTFTSNSQCKECHEEVWNEWTSDEHSQAWFNKPLFPQDPKRTECVSCHASVPILDHGLEKEIVVRADRFEEGIGCIECHKFQDGSNGPLPSIEAACNPTFDARFKTSVTCTPCHAPHGTFDEWQASAWRDKTCQDCHMPEVERPSATGGPVRKVKSHKFLSARQLPFLKDSVKVDAAIEGSKVVVRIANHNTGHNFPGEISNREVVLNVKFVDDLGMPVGTGRASMQAPPRPQRDDKPTTQIRPGEERVYEFPFPEGDWVRTQLKMEYKFLSMWPHGVEFWSKTFDRPKEGE